MFRACSGSGSSDSRWCSLIAPRIHGAILAITGGCDTRFRGLSFSPPWQCPALALLAWRKPARRNRVAPPLLPSLKQASNPTSAPFARRHATCRASLVFDIIPSMKGHSMAKGKRLGTAGSRDLLVLLFAACLPLALPGGATTRTNPPSECSAPPSAPWVKEVANRCCMKAVFRAHWFNPNAADWYGNFGGPVFFGPSYGWEWPNRK